MDDSPFVKLPRELRDQITTLVLTSKHGVVRCRHKHYIWMPDPPFQYLSADCPCRPSATNPCIHLMLGGWPLTCKQAYKESGSLFYSSNIFIFTMSRWAPRMFELGMDRTLQKMSSINLLAIRHVHIDSGKWEMDIWKDFGHWVDSEPDFMKQWDEATMVKGWMSPKSHMIMGFDCHLSGNTSYVYRLGIPNFWDFGGFTYDLQMNLSVADTRDREEEIERGFQDKVLLDISHESLSQGMHQTIDQDCMQLKEKFKQLLNGDLERM